MAIQQKIQVLSPQEALKIAAGEVIERPAHVVKELIENALDAGATSIDVYIKKVGKSLIRIVDNGCGMGPADAHACFLAHATSKIRHLGDLETVMSFGFRGEALASIAAISKVTLTTKSDQAALDDLGTEVVYSESTLLSQTDVSCPTGTDINIADLFFNTPVRKKFLKQDETEWNAIQQIVHAFCLSNPSVSFRLYQDSKLVLNAPAVTIAKDRAAQLWDYDCAQNLIALSDDEHNGLTLSPPFRISGFISHHNFWRYGRQQIHFFVNKRWVKNTELSKGLLKGYLNVLPADRFPAALIFIEIEPQFIDVNVHPKKEEVKFVRPGVVQTTLAMMVKKTLEDHLSKKLAPPQKTQVEQPVLEAPMESIVAPSFDQAFPTNTSFERVHQKDRPFYNVSEQSFRGSIPIIEQSKVADDQLKALFDFEPNPSISTIQIPLEVLPEKLTFNIIGQLFKTYILLEKDDEIVFVDQHAAHERVLYEKYQKSFEQQHGTTLLFPETLRLSPQLTAGVLEHKNFFEQQGIDLDALGTHDLVIRSSPPQLKGPSLKEFITDAAHFIHEHHSLDQSLFGKEFNQHLHAQMACKSAVKAGDILTQQQMQQLLADLHDAENRFICAHGRPTTWSIPKSQFEKQFQRC